jgi:DNA polymerase III epsilon subunit family exonuclease
MFLDKEFVIFDVETTGLSPQAGDRVVEIAALKIKNFKPIDEFQTLINPERPLSMAAFEVNQISAEMLVDAPKACDILPDLVTFLGDAVLIGHNIRFDLGFLHYELQRAGLFKKNLYKGLDTVRLARQMMPHLGRYPLWRVAYALGIQDVQQHRAMADVKITFQVFVKLIMLAEEKDMLKEIFLP